MLSQLEAIESGQVRDAEVLIQNILRFLFLVKNRKLMTIPKVINITDNLLANNAIRDCSLRALTHLSYELFFNQEDLETVDEAELNTEREFIFSILMKFINYARIQQVVYIIMLGHRENISYRSESIGGILNVLDKYQTSEDVLDVQYLAEIMSLSRRTILTNAAKFVAVVQRLTFRNLKVELNLFAVLLRKLLLTPNVMQGDHDQPKIDDLVVTTCEKAIGAALDILLDGQQQSCPLLVLFIKSVTPLPNDLHLLVKERLLATQFERILSLRFVDISLFSLIIQRFLIVDSDVIYAMHIFICGHLDKGVDVDRFVLHQLLSDIHDTLDYRTPFGDDTLKQLILENVDIFVEVLKIPHKKLCLDNGRFLVGLLQTYYCGVRPISVCIEYNILNCIEILVKHNVLALDCVKLLIQHFVDHTNVMFKKRSQKLAQQTLVELHEYQQVIGTTNVTQSHLLEQLQECSTAKR